MRRSCAVLCGLVLTVSATAAVASYTNFEVAHVHPIALTPAGDRLLVVNTPGAVLEIFALTADGGLEHEAIVPVGIEPVSVTVRDDTEAWVVNHVSDSVSIVDLTAGVTVETLRVGDEPTDVAFAGGKAFVALAGEDRLLVLDLANLGAPTWLPLFGRKPRALTASPDGMLVHAVVLRSGNLTTAVNANIIFGNNFGFDPARLAVFGFDDLRCDGQPPPPYPPLPAGIVRNPALVDPPSGIPEVGLIVRWEDPPGRWVDEAGQDWTHCLPIRLPDHDLFTIDATTLAVGEIDHLGTSLFDVSVNPTTGRIYVPNTEARNFVRFEHPLGVQGHVVDNRLSIIDPAAGDLVTIVDLNSHVDRSSDPATNLPERLASISQPGMMAWRPDGLVGYMTAIGSNKLFSVDATCSAPACIFGPDRSAPRAVDVGGGPTGVAFSDRHSRLYVLNRFDNTITLVDEPALTVVDTVDMHDPSSATILEGRRFLYDAVLTSGHGDAACSSCHLFGDHDGLAWDLGNPEGDFAPYSLPNDNVRFIAPFGGAPVGCDPATCASHQGFDPQKGPMTTQTLRGMLEPLHWRGDRATMNNFNQAFPGLMGTEDIGPIAGEPAGLSMDDMERFRQFSLGIAFPPNPHRNVDDTLPNGQIAIPGTTFTGNPAVGATLYDTLPSDAGQPCQACHAHPFGAAGGKLGGVMPAPMTSVEAAALFNGDADLSPHNDLKVAHLRNIYDKFGPRFGTGAGAPPDSVSGFGLIHDGTIPDLLTFLSTTVFTLSPANTAEQVRDISAFVTAFDTGTKPCVGQQVTVPEGTPPTGTPAEEALLTTLLSIADLSSGTRHGELIATGTFGTRVRAFHLTGGSWMTDVAGEPLLTTTELRELATGPITFTCTPQGSGPRLGGDRDEDTHLDGDDCAPVDAMTWTGTDVVQQLMVSHAAATTLSWDPQPARPGIGPTITYDLLGGLVSDLRPMGLVAATSCVETELPAATHDDLRAGPPLGDGFFYLVRARNACGAGPSVPRGGIDGIGCTP